MIYRFKILLMSGALATTLAACSGNTTNPPATEGTDNQASAPSTDVDSQNSQFLTAAEHFETLTELAATGTPADLATLIDNARTAANGVRDALQPAEREQLDGQLASIERAQQSGDKTDIALSAVEGYRLLVSSAPDTASVPRQVSLLDYAGFRYQANLSAVPARWDDALLATDFADQQWAEIETRVGDRNLHDEMAQALSSMRQAAEAKDTALARSASTKELDLVDNLEAYFAPKP